MITAAKIMKKKILIKEELDDHLSAKRSDELWRKATARLNKILKKYEALPKGVHTHTDNFIFPSAAIYLTAGEYMCKEEAYAVIENTAVARTCEKHKKLVKMMKLPFMPGLFVKMWDPITKKMFGESSGFKNRFYPKKKGEYRMDILDCPYCRYFSELGCAELTKIFCENDERIYGDLPNLRFERKSTLGKGGDRCDFCIKRVR